MDWQAIWNSIVNFFKSNAWNILWFFVILVVGIIVIKIVLRLVKKLFSRTKIEKMAQQFVITILKFVLYLALIRTPRIRSRQRLHSVKTGAILS